MTQPLETLAENLVLGTFLVEAREAHGPYDLVAHWSQGEFHHDVVLHFEDRGELPGRVLVVSVNCNGGVKEVVAFDRIPDRWALWHERCPDSEEFDGELPPILGQARTVHWFDPCELLTEDARSELKPEHRTRQRGGGWIPSYQK